MHILLLEDEYLVAESLLKLVRQLEPGATISGPIATVKQAKELLASGSFDLIIADIQLADGISLDVFTKEAIHCPVIFTTAFNEYAIRAFKVNSIDYLLKPVDVKELRSAFDKFHLIRSKYGNEAYLQQLSELLGDFRNGKKYKERFAVHAGRNIILVPVTEVACFVKEEIIFLVTIEGRKLITDYRSLDEVEELLNPRQFFRANRQFIVHLAAIDSLKSDETGKICVRLKLQSSQEIVVSKEKAAAFRKWVEE